MDTYEHLLKKHRSLTEDHEKLLSRYARLRLFARRILGLKKGIQPLAPNDTNSAVQVYFIQTCPTPNEGPHAQEVIREVFIEAARSQVDCPIEWDADMGALYLRIDSIQGIEI